MTSNLTLIVTAQAFSVGVGRGVVFRGGTTPKNTPPLPYDGVDTLNLFQEQSDKFQISHHFETSLS